MVILSIGQRTLILSSSFLSQCSYEKVHLFQKSGASRIWITVVSTLHDRNKKIDIFIFVNWKYKKKVCIYNRILNK